MSHHSLLAFPHHLRRTCRRPTGYTWVYAFQMQVLGLKRALSMNQNIDAIVEILHRATGGGEMMIWMFGVFLSDLRKDSMLYSIHILFCMSSPLPVAFVHDSLYIHALPSPRPVTSHFYCLLYRPCAYRTICDSVADDFTDSCESRPSFRNENAFIAGAVLRHAPLLPQLPRIASAHATYGAPNVLGCSTAMQYATRAATSPLSRRTRALRGSVNMKQDGWDVGVDADFAICAGAAAS
ncbi:hypothetical protein B0H13DRAFT_2667959 [Mycena leptocephala]|nr:hypothetical protein B0H13DRAFT_2667959 [Mycena leptocephala]